MDDTPAMDDAAPAADPPSGLAKVQCITELRPWGTVTTADGATLRPIELDEIVSIPRDQAEIMKKNRHVVEIR